MISREKMIALYSAMVKHRMLAEQSSTLPRQAKRADAWLLAPGREAMVAAVTADLRQEDSLAHSQDQLLSAFVKSPSSKASRNGHNRNRHHQNGHGQLTLSDDWTAVSDAAEAHQAAKDGAVALVLCESRVKADIWRRQLQRMSRGNLPLILVRLYEAEAGKAPRKAQGDAPEALEFGVPLIAVDAADVRAVYRVASESIARARQGRGPTLIDCVDFGREDGDSIGDMAAVLAKKRILNAGAKQKIESTAEREANKVLRPLLQ